VNFSTRVTSSPDGFRWEIISDCGRPLVVSREVFSSDFAAIKEGRKFAAQARATSLITDHYGEYL